MELAVQSGAEAGKVFKIDRPLMIIGRQVGSDIQVNDSQVSRRHLQVEDRNGTVFVTDLGSANGSYVNGNRLVPNQTVALKSGDSLRVGDTNLGLQGASVASSGEATAIGGSYAAAAQGFQPQPSSQQPYSPPVGGSGAYGAYSQPQPNQFTANQYSNNAPPQSYNYNAGGQPGYAPVPPVQPYGQVSGQPSYSQPYSALPPLPPKKSNTGLLVLIGVLAVAVIGGIVATVVVLSGSKNTITPTPIAASSVTAGIAATVTTSAVNNTTAAVNQPTAVVNQPTAVVVNNPTTAASKTTTVANNPTPVVNNPTAGGFGNGTANPLTIVPQLPNTRGASGTNQPPPSPVRSKATPTPDGSGSDTTAVPGTTKTASGSGSLVPVKGLGITISFPSDWKSQIDTTKNEIVADAPDGVTYVVALKATNFSGETSARVTAAVNALKKSHSDLKITKAVASSTDGSVAAVEYEYTDSTDNTLYHTQLVGAKDSADDTITYFFFFASSADTFDSQSGTFGKIADSIKFGS